MVHHAIQRWLFPGNPALPIFLETTALQAGLADPAQRAEAIRLAEMLLTRLQRHPLWQEIDQAEERYHEVPYARFAANGRLDTGYIDLLYRTADRLADRGFQDRLLAFTGRRGSCRRALPPADAPLRPGCPGFAARAGRVRLCFLDDDGQVSLQEML